MNNDNQVSKLNIYSKWVIRWRYLIVLTTIALVFIAASGVRFLTFSADYHSFFDDDNKQLMAFEELENTYSKEDNIMFVLAPKDKQVFTNKTLEAIEWLTKEAWQIPYSYRVDSISNFQHTYAEEDDLIVDDLVSDANNISQEKLDKLKTIAIKEPQLLNRLISPTAHVTAVNTSIQFPNIKPVEETPEVVAFARDLADKMRKRYPEIDVYLTGIVVLNNSFPEASKQDMGTLTPMMYVIILLVLGLIIKGFSGIVATLFVISFAIFSAMGIAGWFGVVLTGPSSTAPVMIMTLAVADSVHLLITMLYEIRHNGRDKNAAIIESIRINFQPIFLTSVTTGIGFLSMNFGDVPPFRDLGNIVTVGVLMAFILSVTFLPAMLSILPNRTKINTTTKPHFMENIAEFVIRQKTKLLIVISTILIINLAIIPQNELNDSWVEYFDETFAFRVATDFTTKNLTGIYNISYSIDSGTDGGISNPEFLKKVENFANWYKQQPETVHISVITDTIKRLNKNLHGDDESYYRLPESRELTAQYLLLYEMSLPYGLDLNNQINVSKSATRISISLKNLSTNEFLDLEKRADNWLKQNVPPVMQANGASVGVIFAHIGYQNIRSMLGGAVIALILISFILAFALRSFKHGMISLIPNLMPIAMAFGVWGIINGQVGIALSIVAGVSLGIVVDDTVHFLTKYLRARNEQNLDVEDAIRYAFKSVGTALVVTSVVLVAGFMMLSFSHFKVNADMGLLTGITIVLALFIDFLFLPPLLMLFKDKQ
jgi:predicted RND superfamily exporter protein